MEIKKIAKKALYAGIGAVDMAVSAAGDAINTLSEKWEQAAANNDKRRQKNR